MNSAKARQTWSVPPPGASQFQYNADFGAMLLTDNGSSLKFEFWSIAGGGTLIDQYTIAATAPVRARQVFYNDSAFDGNSPAAGALDDGAIAADKQALLPGATATSANYTSYSRGINGVIVDLLNPTGTITAADFAFHVGNSSTPNDWTAAPAPQSISVRPGAGDGGADRVTIVWPSGAIRNTWLQATVKSTAATGLAAADVFYFGNTIGETGNGATAQVNSNDEIAARQHARSFTDPANIDDPFDFNRDGFVNAIDQILARANATTLATSLKLIIPSISAMANNSASLAIVDAAWRSLTAERDVSETAPNGLASEDQTLLAFVQLSMHPSERPSEMSETRSRRRMKCPEIEPLTDVQIDFTMANL